MIDINKPRLTEKNENDGCTILGADQIDIECGSAKNAVLISNCLYRLFELENAIESGELVPVVHGRWNRERKIDKLYPIQCSSCGIEWLFEPYKTVENMNHNFCPNCGAKMDLEEEK